MFHRQTKSVHYVNAYAIHDRIDFSGLAETLPIAQLSIDDLLLTDSDHSSMMANFVILAAGASEPLRPVRPWPYHFFWRRSAM